MYLDFILDIASVGDQIRISTINEEVEGEIVKISSSIIAIKKDDGSLVFKKDNEITNVILSPDKDALNEVKSSHSSENEDKNNIEDPSKLDLETNSDDTKVEIGRTSLEELEQFSSPHEVTIGQYDSSWDSIDKSNLLQLVGRIKVYLSRKECSTIVSANANVREVLKRSFRVNAKEHPKLTVNTRTIIERNLYNELKNFSIGETLPVVIYYHNVVNPERVFLTLLPNTIGGYVDILKDAIQENHYKQAKRLCYFLISQITEARERKHLFTLLKALKPVYAFSQSQKIQINSTRSTYKKIPKDYKEIEKQLNQLVSDGSHNDAISLIDTMLQEQDIEEKYKSSLLLRKAQIYSSMTDYESAKSAYLDLVQFREKIGGEPNYLSHLYTELARLQAMDKSGLDEAKKSVERALSVNPLNKYASSLLEQINEGSLSFVSISSNSESPEDDKEDNEMILDSDESALVISKMIDIDIKEHACSHELIIANGGVPTAAIADTIFQEAKQNKEIDLGERYPIYLEAAKAYRDLPVGSYDYSNYLEAVAFYAVYKGNFLLKKFSNDIKSGKTTNIKYLKRLRDSACSYYIESLNLLSSDKGNILSLILCNYIKLNTAIINLEKQKEVDFSGNFNKVFLSCINSSDYQINEVAWRTIIVVGSASSNAWNQLWKYRYDVAWRKEFKKALRDDDKRPEIYRIINNQNKSLVDDSLPPGKFLKESLLYRQTRNVEFSDVLSGIIREELNVHLLTSLLNKWVQIENYIDLLNETEGETKTIIDEILFILKPYPNRTQVERTNILIQVQTRIDEQISFINENTTYYGRTFFFPLLMKWKRTLANLLEKKIADTLPQLIVETDPPYIVNTNGKQVVNLIVKNQGESTAEGCVMAPCVVDIGSGTSVNGRNRYDNEIPAGSNLDVPMNLPIEMADASSIKLSMSISAIYQGKELPSQMFEFTIEKEPESTLVYDDIPWKDGPIPASQMFKGRQKILGILKKHYTSIEKEKPYILYGLTRTGKSSILKYLGEELDKTKIIIHGLEFDIATFEWDLSQASNFGNAQDMWEYLLYDQIYDYLDEYIDEDELNELRMPEKPRAKDLNNILQFLFKKHVYPMFLVDEFSYIKVLMDKNVVNPAFLHTLRQFSLAGLASFIYAGTYDIKELIKDPKYGITGQLVNAVEEQIAEIDSNSAEELINVLGNKLRFTKDAIAHIHKLSGDVPYFVQMICKYCGLYAVENKRSIIGYPELEYVIRVLTGEIDGFAHSMVKALPENVFQNNMFSPADPISANVLISSIAYLNRDNKENPRGVGIVELQQLWAKKDIAAYRPLLASSIELLCEKKVLIPLEDDGLPVYKLSVDLFRRWWSVHYSDIDLQLDKLL